MTWINLRTMIIININYQQDTYNRNLFVSTLIPFAFGNPINAKQGHKRIGYYRNLEWYTQLPIFYSRITFRDKLVCKSYVIATIVQSIFQYTATHVLWYRSNWECNILTYDVIITRPVLSGSLSCLRRIVQGVPKKITPNFDTA